MHEIEGLAGELVDRLIELLNCDALGEGGWYDVAFFATYYLGGQVLGNVLPDTGRDPVPGTMGELERQYCELVSRATYFELIRERLGEVIASGVDEGFLVRSVCDAIRRQMATLADTGPRDQNRAEARARLERQADDPAEIAAFRAMLAERDPSAEMLSDDQVAARLRGMAARFAPISAEGALDRWATLANWDKQAALILPDPAFEEWELRRLRRPM